MADVATLSKTRRGTERARSLAGGRFGGKVRRNTSAYGFLIGAVRASRSSPGTR